MDAAEYEDNAYCLTPLGQRMVEDNIRLSFRYVDFYMAGHPETPHHRDELLPVAQEGLMRAVHEYRPERGTQFSTAAWCWMRGYVGHYVRNLQYLRRYDINNIDGFEELTPSLLELSAQEMAAAKDEEEWNQKEVRRLLRRLPLPLRQRLRLYFLHEKTYQEVGDKHGVSKQRAQQSVLEALIQLRKIAREPRRRRRRRAR